MAEVKNEYWERRAWSLYLHAVKDVVGNLGRDAKSIIDVGSAACPYLDWYDWIPHKTSLDLRRPYVAPGINSVKSDFLTWNPDRDYDILTCLQVMEHVPSAEEFAQKILSISKIAVVSLPFMWKAGLNVSHVHDPVDEEKIIGWFGRKPNASFKIKEVVSGSERVIHVYERDYPKRWASLRSRDKQIERAAAGVVA